MHPRRSGGRVALTLSLVVVLAATACAADPGASPLPPSSVRDGSSDASGSSGSSTAGGSVPSMHLGPQGRVAQFAVECGFSHAASDDPIVHPDHHGASHRHDFFGNRETDANSTAASLLGKTTTCNHQLDTASYWAPSLLDHGQPVTPLGSVAYYRPAPGVDPTTLQAYPAGLMMIAGDGNAVGPQPVEVAAWSCGVSSELESEPAECPTSSPLRVRITFPDCWDGHSIDSADHRSHVTRSAAGRCPDSHPVAMPQLTFHILYPVSGPGHDLSLVTGALTTAHADFLNAWDQAELIKEVELCLHRNVVCNVVSNRAED